MSKYKFEDKVVWVTGASSGIGLSVTKLLLAKGAKVIASSRNISELDNLAKSSPNLFPLSLDVSNLDDMKNKLNDKINELQITKLDLVILNAGICKYLNLNEGFSAKTIADNVNINLLGYANCIELSLPLLLKSDTPYLVGVGSAAVYLPTPRAEGYGSAKAGVHYLIESLMPHVNTIHNNFMVSLVAPGFVQTPLTDKNDFSMPFLISSEQAAKEIINGIAKKKRIISFPWKLTFMFKLINKLPHFIKIKLLQRAIKQ